MERDTNQMSQSASLCRSGCGFYGNPSNDGLCSKCYKDAVKRKQSAPSPQLSQSSSSVNHSTAGRNSPISTPLLDSSANLPFLSTTFENSLNTASPTVPSAIIASSAQELITKLESEFQMKRNQKNPKQNENDLKKQKSKDPKSIDNSVENSVKVIDNQNLNESVKQNSINDSNTDQWVVQNETTTSSELSEDSDVSDLSQSDESLENGSENQDSSNQSNTVNTNVDNNSSNGSTQTTPQIDSNQTDPPKTQKKKKNRCTKCKVNVGVIGFPCRCGGTFCSSHRYANEHECTFDYKEHGAEEIRKNNPQVIGEKVTKI